MKKSACSRTSMSVRSGHGAPGRLAAPRLLAAILALFEISALGQIARAQNAERSAAGLASPAAPVQLAAATLNETLQSAASPEELGDLKMLHRNYREALET